MVTKEVVVDRLNLVERFLWGNMTHLKIVLQKLSKIKLGDVPWVAYVL